MHIYAKNISTLSIFASLIFLAFTAVLYVTRNNVRMGKTISAILFFVAIYGVLSYAVLGRTPSDNHTFVFAASKGSEFYREMFMNALLYYPLGLSLTVLIGPWSILISFILSILIELWQYLAGTGVAQGTDVIMNSLGAAIGALPWIIVYFLKKHTSAESGSD